MIMITKFKFLVGTFVLGYTLGSADVLAKVSDDNRLFRQVDNINAAFSACDFGSGPLDEIRAKAVATGAISGAATVASGVSMVSSIVAASKSKKGIMGNEGLQAKEAWDTSTGTKRLAVEGVNSGIKSARMVSTVSSGLAAGANAVSLSLSATSWSNLKKLMNDADDCYRALENITLSTPVRVVDDTTTTSSTKTTKNK